MLKEINTCLKFLVRDTSIDDVESIKVIRSSIDSNKWKTVYNVRRSFSREENLSDRRNIDSNRSGFFALIWRLGSNSRITTNDAITVHVPVKRLI